MSAAPSQLERARDTEAGIRVVRWLGIAFAILQIGVIYAPPEGVTIPWPRIPVAIAFAAVLLGLNAVSTAVERRNDPVLLRRAGILQVAADLGVVIAIIALYEFDTESRFWPLLVLPLLEGAMRERVTGAVAVVVAGVAADTLILIDRYGTLEIISSTAFRAGILLIVAVATGTLADRFETARAAAEDQAARLRRLAELSRDLPARRVVGEVLRDIVDAACELTGARTCEVHLRRDEAWVREAARGMEGETTSLFDRLLLASGGTPETAVVVTDSRRDLLAVPIVSQGEPAGMIVLAGQDHDHPFSDDDRDVLQLLAGHAGAALDATRTIEELEALDVVKDEFFHILAHELRGPMTSLTGYADLLRRKWDTLEAERREEFLDAIERGTARMAKLLRDVQDVSEADRRSLPVEPRPFALAPLLEAIATDEVARSVAHRLEFVPPSEPIVVLADPDRVTQVFANLVSNAVKYSPSGGRVRVQVTTGGDHATVSVTDDGFGIPRHLRSHLFQKFSRLPTPERVAGTGLGLYLSRMLVEAMGGTIGVDSEEGRGSTFRFTLPLAPADGAVPETIAIDGQQATGSRPLWRKTTYDR